MPSQTVAILGASNNPERFAHKALVMLQEHGHTVIPVNPALEDIDGVPVVRSLTEVPPVVDTLTLYVGSARLPAMKEEIVQLRPGRVVFNPGTESPEVQAALDAAGIPWVEDCTLVMLRAGRF
ncbi:MAG TPA: CoA-binding protein [Verrucomicrobiales bacterium]|jgi:predicted CoA-binding protein|nr:CoA-binding protein [Verrucomicrobiales bacterium]